MNYDDFQLVDDTSTQLMQQHYLKLNDFDRTTCVASIFSSIKTLVGYCLHYKPLTHSLNQAVNKAKNKLDNMLKEFSSLFNIPIDNSNSCYEFNLFKILTKLATTSKELIFWQRNEQKDYYKKTASFYLAELTNISILLTSSLENNYFKIFKYF